MNTAMKTVAAALIGAVIAGLAGCNSGGGAGGIASAADSGSSSSSGSGSGGGSSGGGSSSSITAHTIAISYPITDAIENLGAGFYRRVGSAQVTDNEGNPVADGTMVYFRVIDSVVATGSIETANSDGITGGTLTDMGPRLGDGVTATSFDTAYVYRNAAYHFLGKGDPVYLINADEADKLRWISATATNSITNNILTLSSNYVGTYPNSTYASGTTSYVAGISALGASIRGEDASGNLVTGYGVTKDGVVKFHITYPANIATINTGCGNSSVDTRTTPVGAAQVYVVAWVNSTVSTVNQDFCFSPIAGGSFDVIPGSLSSSGTISATLHDGGDTVAVPFQLVTVYVSDEDLTDVTLSGGLSGSSKSRVYRTDANGNFDVTVTVAGASGGTANVNFYAGTLGSAVAAVSIP